MTKFKLAFLVGFCLFISSFQSGFGLNSISIGISPGYLDLGEIEPGESKIGRFYMVTPSDELFLVYLSSIKASNINILQKEKYNNSLPFYSEEDSSSWINFLSNPMKLLPANQTAEKKSASLVKGMREVSFVLKVPENAEPGYHIGEISMDPRIVGETEGINMKAIVPMNYILMVKGNAERSGKIIDITTNGFSGSNLRLKIFYKNTGSVTTSIDRSEIYVLDKDGKTIGTVLTNRGYVRPGEVKELDGLMGYEYIEEGEYKVKGLVSYLTGVAEADGTIHISKPSNIPTGEVVTKDESKFPLWILLLIIIIILLYIIFKR